MIAAVHAYDRNISPSAILGINAGVILNPDNAGLNRVLRKVQKVFFKPNVISRNCRIVNTQTVRIEKSDLG